MLDNIVIASLTQTTKCSISNLPIDRETNDIAFGNKLLRLRNESLTSIGEG